MIKWLVGHHLLQAVIVVFCALLFFGVSTAGSLAAILGSFALSRLLPLVAEVVRKPRSIEEWRLREREWTERYRRLEPEALAEEAIVRGLNLHAGPEEVARASLRADISAFPAPRPRLETGAEMLGVLGFVLFLPAAVALYTHDFYSLRVRHGWAGAAVALLSVLLYLGPQLWAKSVSNAAWRSAWWGVPFVPLLLLFIVGVTFRHPYLDPLRSDHEELAADRVLALRDNIVAATYADWVMDYARQLDRKGFPMQAAHYYREALRLDSQDDGVRARLEAIEGGNTEEKLEETAGASAFAPYWSPDQKLKSAPRTKVDASLEKVAGCTVILVAVGEVPDLLLDAVAQTVEHELRLPVLVKSGSVPQPPHTRVRGLLTGMQWETDSLYRAFVRESEPFPSAPLRYLLLTPVDIYINDSAYAFSATCEWGGVVSFARFGAPERGSLGLHRTVKQSLAVLVKSFGVPASPDRRCVTSYTKSLEEFDRKGNRPSAPTMAQFQKAVAEMNVRWQRHQAR